MGPWPGLEPGPAGPQPTVLTATLPQPCASGPPTDCISSVPRDEAQTPETNGLKRCSPPLQDDEPSRRYQHESGFTRDARDSGTDYECRHSN